MTMRIICPVIVLLAATFLGSNNSNNKVNGANNAASFRRKPVRRRGSVPEWPYSFFVSQIEQGKDWCMTANKGVSDGTHVGFDICDFRNAPSSQLFLLDRNGMIHAKEDETMCVVVDEENEIRSGHSLLKFRDCNAQGAFSTFVHNRDIGLLRVKNSSTHCIKQKGPRPQNTDSLRAFTCDAQEPGMIFEYRENQCSTRLADVSCCENSDCPNGWDCEDYSCICSIDTANGIECCDDNDCPFENACSDSTCIPIAPPNRPTIRPPPPGACNVNHLGTDCCSDDECPLNYFCESNTCLTPAFSLVSTARRGNQDWCIAATVNRRNEILEDVVYERCSARNAANQKWHIDIHGKIHSTLDLDTCLTVGPNVDSNGLVEIRADTCYINTPFHHDSIANQMRLDQDQTYCLESFAESSNDGAAVRGVPCMEAGIVELVVE